MIFNELYSAYYNAVAGILEKALDGPVDERAMREIIQEKAFGESAFTIIPALKNGEWALMDERGKTTLAHSPTLPLTTLQKQWLKAISQDSRIRLFGVQFEGLDDVEPLFTPSDYYIYDKYEDGDPFEDEGYIARFRFLLTAIREKTPITVHVLTRKGTIRKTNCLPVGLEYSPKDDKFRLLTSGCHFVSAVNVAKITACVKYAGTHVFQDEPIERETASVRITVRDERNALERVLLHFAHFDKQVVKLGRKQYSVLLHYDSSDATEIVIRILSFGPLVKVEEPQSFVALVQDRLRRQKKLHLS